MDLVLLVQLVKRVLEVVKPVSFAIIVVVAVAVAEALRRVD